MLCDDQEDILYVCAKFLRSRYNVITSNSGKSCLETYAKEKKSGRKVEVLLLDYRLGDMFGDEVARKIRSMNGTKVILASAYDLDDSVLSKLKAENCIASQLNKPFSMAELERMVVSVLDTGP